MYKLIDNHEFSGQLTTIVGKIAAKEEFVSGVGFINQIMGALDASRASREHLEGIGLLPTIKEEQVIFSGPVTTIIQPDGTKTQVKCAEGDKYDAKYGYLLAHFMIAYGMTRTQVGKLLKKIEQDSIDQRTKGFVKMLAKEARRAQRKRDQGEEEEDEFEVLTAARNNRLQEVMWQAMQNMIKRSGTCPDCKYYCRVFNVLSCQRGCVTPATDCTLFVKSILS